MTNFEQIRDALSAAARAVGNLTLTATRTNTELISITYRALDVAAQAAKAAEEEAAKKASAPEPNPGSEAE